MTDRCIHVDSEVIIKWKRHCGQRGLKMKDETTRLIQQRMAGGLYDVNEPPAPFEPTKGRAALFPFRQLVKAGQWFFIPFDATSQTSIAAVASRKGKQLGRQFSVRKNVRRGGYIVSCVKG